MMELDRQPHIVPTADTARTPPDTPPLDPAMYQFWLRQRTALLEQLRAIEELLGLPQSRPAKRYKGEASRQP